MERPAPDYAAHLSYILNVLKTKVLNQGEMFELYLCMASTQALNCIELLINIKPTVNDVMIKEIKKISSIVNEKYSDKLLCDQEYKILCRILSDIGADLMIGKKSMDHISLNEMQEIYYDEKFLH